MPRLPQKTPELQLFIRTTASVGKFRNMFQHLDSEIGKIQGSTNPIMGVLSWVTSNDALAYTIATGTGSEDTQMHSLSVDTTSMSFAQDLVFGTGNEDIELAQLHERCNSFRHFLGRWLDDQEMLVCCPGNI